MTCVTSCYSPSYQKQAGWHDSVTTQMFQRGDWNGSENGPYLIFNLNMHDVNIFQISIHSAQSTGRPQLRSREGGEMSLSHLPASSHLSQGVEAHGPDVLKQ